MKFKLLYTFGPDEFYDTLDEVPEKHRDMVALLHAAHCSGNHNLIGEIEIKGIGVAGISADTGYLYYILTM